MMPSVAIAILNWNGKHFLEQFLPSVVQSTYPNKSVVVIDNASTDDSLAFLQEHYPAVQIVKNATNGGFAQGYNEGLKEIRADYYVLLNSDVKVSPGWIEPVINLLEKNTLIAACQPKILQYAQPDHFEYAGACGGWMDALGYPFSRGRVFEVCEKDEGQYDTPSPIFWASGAALFIRSRCFHEMKGFDPYFFAHMEEIDLCWRLQAAGHQIYSCPSSVVYHVGGGTLPKGNSRKVFLNFRNNLVMIAKNRPALKAVGVIGCRFLLDAIAAYQHLLSGDRGFFMAVLNAHFAFFRWLLFDRSQSLFPVKRTNLLSGMYRGSIVWAFYLKGKKTFREIVQ